MWSMISSVHQLCIYISYDTHTHLWYVLTSRSCFFYLNVSFYRFFVLCIFVPFKVLSRHICLFRVCEFVRTSVCFSARWLVHMHRSQCLGVCVVWWTVYLVPATNESCKLFFMAICSIAFQWRCMCLLFPIVVVVVVDVFRPSPSYRRPNEHDIDTRGTLFPLVMCVCCCIDASFFFCHYSSLPDCWWWRSSFNILVFMFVRFLFFSSLWFMLQRQSSSMYMCVCMYVC